MGDDTYVRKEVSPRLSSRYSLCHHHGDLPTHTSVGEAILQGVSQSDAVLLVVSPSYLESAITGAELRILLSCAGPGTGLLCTPQHCTGCRLPGGGPLLRRGGGTGSPGPAPPGQPRQQRLAGGEQPRAGLAGAGPPRGPARAGAGRGAGRRAGRQQWQ